ATMQALLLDARRSGTRIETVQARLTKDGFVPVAGSASLDPRASIAVDLDGDGKPEWVLLLSEAAAAHKDPSSCKAAWLWVVGLPAGVARVRLDGDDPALQKETQLYILSCDLRVLGDVTGDGLPELDVDIRYNVWMQLVGFHHRIFSAGGGA